MAIDELFTFYVDRLKLTEREGIEDLTDYLKENGILEAPASGGNHCHHPGGLLEHSLNVYNMAVRIAHEILPKEEYDKLIGSIVICSLLHDIGKIGDYGKEMYVKNMIKDGKPTKSSPEQKYKQSESKPYKRNPDLTGVPHAIRSIKIATLFIDLTEEEEWAILTHDGLYDFMKYEIPGRETPLSMIIHFADLWATKILEAEKTEEEE